MTAHEKKDAFGSRPLNSAEAHALLDLAQAQLDATAPRKEFPMADYGQAENAYYNEEAATKSDRRPSHVGSALLAIDEEGQQLLEAIRELERRLSDVLRSDVDSADKMAGEPREALVALAERLTSHSGTVRMARQYVVSILERLEL